MAHPFTLSTADAPESSLRVLRLAGELDALGIDALRDAVDAAAKAPRPHTVVLDLAELTYINSRGIGAFVALHAHLQRVHVTLVLAAAQGGVRDVLELVGIPHIIPCTESVDDASAAQPDAGT